MSTQSLSFRVGGDFGPLSNSMKGWAGKIGGLVAGAFSAAAVGAFASGIMEAGAAMETFEVRLATLMGSAAAARKRLEELAVFGAETPFELDGIVKAETTLRGFGAAAEEIMPGLIDFAAITGSDLSQAAIDIGKAWQQGATGLESDWGRVLRKQVELREGVNATTMDLEDFREALLDALNEGAFAGGGAKMSRTWSGMISTLADEWTGFQRQVADGGIFDNVKAGLAEVLAAIGNNREAIEDVAELISVGLWDGLKLVAMTAGAAATGMQGIGMMAASAVGIVAMLGYEILTITQGMRDTMKAAAEASGNAKLAAAARGIDSALGTMSVSMAFIEADSRAWVKSVMEAKDPYQQTLDLIQKIEAGAKGISETPPAAPAPPALPAAADGDGALAAVDDGTAALVEAIGLAGDLIAEVNALDATAYEQMTARRDALAQRTVDLYHAGGMEYQAFVETQAGIDAWYADELTILDQKIADDRQRLHEDEMRRIEDERDARISAAGLQLDAVSGILTTISGLYDAENEKQKAAHKRWATSAILVDTAVGIMRAFAQFGWPGGILPAAQVGVAGAVQAAGVNKAHQGGIIGEMFPDEADVTFAPGRRVRTLRGESAVVGNTQTTRAMTDANRSNGATLGGGPAVLELHVGRVTQREIIRTDIARGGQIPGYVSQAVGRGGRMAGWTGRGAPL